jgi:hypothetical protein
MLLCFLTDENVLFLWYNVVEGRSREHPSVAALREGQSKLSQADFHHRNERMEIFTELSDSEILAVLRGDDKRHKQLLRHSSRGNPRVFLEFLAVEKAKLMIVFRAVGLSHPH